MNDTQSLRDHIISLLRGGQAYDTFDEIVADFPADKRGVVPEHAERSAWQILSHMQISLVDIVGFSRNHDGSYEEMNWPDDYWPKHPAPPAPNAWDEAAKQYLAERASLESLVTDPAVNLFAPFPWGSGQTLLREALLAADHQSYHLGELVMLRRLLG